MCYAEKKTVLCFTSQGPAATCRKIWELACKDAYALDDLFREDWELAKCEAEKRRVVLDQIASLTDLDALLLMQRYCSESDAVREFLMKSESTRSQL